MKKFIFSILVCLMLTSSRFTPVEANKASSQTVFNDISTSYAQEAILRLAKRNIVSGNGAGAFLPRGKVNRAEFVSMVSRMLKMEPVNNDLSAYRDVSKLAWYYGSVHTGTNLGIVSGKGARLFKPLDCVTRQEAAVMVVRAMKLADHQEHQDLSEWYKDAGNIAPWASAEVATATSKGWVQGSGGYFRPNDYITREETAVLLDRILHYGNVMAVLDKDYESEISDIRMGWLYDGTTKQYISYAKTAGLNTLSPRWYYIESSGVVSDRTDLDLLEWAKHEGRKVWAMLGNRSNAEVTHKVLNDSKMRQSVVKSLVGYVEKYKLDGINVDFENVIPEDRYDLTSFIRELSSELQHRGTVLSIDVSPDLNSDWTEAFDYAALGEYADFVVLMGYDEHWGGSPQAGSVSSLPWLSSAIDKLLTQVPASKAVIALPLYTRDWSLHPSLTSEDISLIEQGIRIRNQSASIVWNDLIGQYEASYIQSGLKHKIWTEDARSLSVKHKLVMDRQTAGVAYWYSGSETPDIWQAVRNMRRYQSFEFDI